MSGGIAALVPVKPFARAKSRLAGDLGDMARAQLAAALARQTIARLKAHGGFRAVLVATADPAAAALALSLGAIPVADTVNELNGALGLAIAYAKRASFSAVLIVPADLPLLAKGDLDEALAALAGGANVAICPSIDGGTNLLGLAPPDVMPPQFGVGSAVRHEYLARALDLRVVELNAPGARRDLDRADDLAMMGALPESRRKGG